MLTSLYKGKEKNKNKLSLKRTTMSPPMKLGNKPNQIGTKMEVASSLFSHTVPPTCTLTRFIWFIYSVFPEKGNCSWDFRQPISRMLTEDDDDCLKIAAGRGGGGTVVWYCLYPKTKHLSAVSTGVGYVAQILCNSQTWLACIFLRIVSVRN